jgi:hypothetical protein
MADPGVPRVSWRMVLAAITASAALYVWGLDNAPVYLGGDEAHFAVHGAAIARDGRNLDGMRFPLFVNLWDPKGDQTPTDLQSRWYQPMLFYITALELRLLPLTETTLRLPTALIAGALIPLLMFCVGLRLFRSPLLAGVAAMFVALSPTQFILGRQALDYVLPLPFILGWLWCVVAFLQGGSLKLVAAAGLLLGVGFYSYIACWVFMPLCLAMTWGAVLLSKRPDAIRACMVVTAAFAVCLVPALVWFLQHPEMLLNTLGRYRLAADATDQGGLALGKVLNTEALAGPLDVYLSFFDPRMLFINGGPVPTTSLGRSGVFLLPVAALLPVGLYAIAAGRLQWPIAFLLVTGWLLAPIPGALAVEGGMIQRGLPLILFTAFIAAAGLGVVTTSRGLLRRVVVAGVLGASLLQFGYVYRDYFTHYQLRSAFYYDSIAFVHVAADLLSEPEVPAVYFSRELDDVGSKWRFYVTKHRREELLDRTHYVDALDPALDAARAGSLLVVYADGPTARALIKGGIWQPRKEIADIDNRPASLVLERAAR